LPRRLLAEYLGALLLAALVIGSGIAAQNVSPHDVGLQLAENAAATAAGLYAIILMFGPISGGHFNPVVSLADAAFGGLSWTDALAYLPTQVAGCVSGAVVANLMFDIDAVSISGTNRGTAPHGFAEVVATGIKIQVERLTGVYKNMPRGIVALVFRCAPVGGQLIPTDEALSVSWITIDEVREYMDPAYVVRVTDAFAQEASARVHDGVNLVHI
jgi:hypothetical protein